MRSLMQVCLSGLMLALAQPALARDVYECNFPEIANNLGYMPPLVVLSPDPNGQTATVVDGFIQGVKGGPIDVAISAQNKQRITVGWELALSSVDQSGIRITYRLSIQKATLAANLTARPLNYSNVFTAQGKCSLKKV